MHLTACVTLGYDTRHVDESLKCWQPTYSAADIEQAIDRRVGECVGPGGMAAKVRAPHKWHC